MTTRRATAPEAAWRRAVIPAWCSAGPMAPHPRLRGRAAELQGRRGECGVLDRLIEAVRAGESRALVLCGEAGAGKTTPEAGDIQG